MGEVQHRPATPHADANADAEKEAGIVVKDNPSSDGDDTIDRDAQAGVQNIEAVTSVWTTRSLIAAYAMIFIIYFVETMQQGAMGSITPYVTSAFAAHSLTPTVSIFSNIIGGVFQLSLAKILDVFGRPQGYLLSVFFATIGLIMMAACNNVETYAAAQVFYTVGNNAILYCVSVFVADTSSLRNRAMMTAFSASPNLITIWLAGPISEAFLNGPGWRWGFGTFCILVPVFTLPLYGLFVYNFKKAKNQGLIPESNSQRTAWESFIYYCREFDAIGLFLLSAGLALFLLPFNIYYFQAEGWRAPVIIALLVVGLVVIVAFALWEKFFAAITFIPYSLLLDRTVFGACILGATLFISYYCWMSYFTSFLQVVNNLDVTKASYVAQTYSMGSSLTAIAVGVLVRYTGRVKPVTLYMAVPLSIFGLALMINFRKPDVNIGYIIMCQIFVSVAGGTIIICDPIAAMAAATHQHIAVVLAVLSMFSQIGGAIGLSVAAAIWQGVFPVKLAEYLPESELPNLLAIYADLTVQLSYPVGSPARIANQDAYADGQKMMLIAGTAIWILGFVGTLMWRDIQIIGMKQVKGHVV